MINSVILCGNLTREPEVRFTQSGTAVVTLRIAVTRVWYKDREKRESTLFVDVVAWGHLAENCGKHLDKGSKIVVDGRLESRDWVTKDTNQKRTSIEVVANEIQFLTFKGSGRDGGDHDAPPRGSDTHQGQASEDTRQGSAPAEDEVPF